MKNIPNWVLVLGLLVLALFMLRVGAAIPALITFLLGIAAPIIQDVLRERLRTSIREKKPLAKMTLPEAREVLGVSENATEEEIKEAYLSMIKKNHPDNGGSKYLASKINEAKKILLGK